MTAFLDIAPCSLVEGDRRFRSVYCLHHQGDEWLNALMMEAVRTSETSVNFYQTTRRDVPEGCHLHTHRRENLKSQNAWRSSWHSVQLGLYWTERTKNKIAKQLLEQILKPNLI
jgi:hypothetical protein